MKLPPHKKAMSAKLRIETLEQRNLLASDIGVSHNRVDPLDANRNGEVDVADAVATVNAIHHHMRGMEMADGDFDVNADRSVDLADVMAIINGTNRRRRFGSDDGPPRDDQPLEVRSIDGTGNNLSDDDAGAAGTQLLRSTTVEYGDGVSTPAGEDRASAREISNLVSAQDESVVNDRGLTDLLWQWGQFIDHDIDLTEGADPAEAFDIDVPTGDVFFDPASTGEATIGLNRSVYDEETGDSVDDPRQQINQITAFLDGSMIYGSDDERASALRTFEGGRLATSDGDLLPFNAMGLENAGGTSDTLFLAGDVRANEQAGLTAMHTVWVREHNLQANRIAAENPELSDEEIFQQARAIVIAEIQAITFNEYLPALLGEGAIDRYRGYDDSIDPGISNVFSTAAYRFGHTMLSPELLRLNENGEVIEDGSLALRDAFFNPANITDQGIDSLLRGLASQEAQEIDTLLIDDVRNFLFGPPGSGGFDLASLNIQRGRDHGLADYNQVRADYGLEPVESFADITSDPDVRAALNEAYAGDVNNIDVWVGVLAEDHVAGGSLGETGTAILVDQFSRIRDGDRLWYENTFSGDELRELRSTSLADVIERNTEITGLQENVFFAADEQPDLGRGRMEGEGRLGESPRGDFNRDGADNARAPRPDDLVGDPPAPERGPAGFENDVPADEPNDQRRRGANDRDQVARASRDQFAADADDLFGQFGLGRNPLG